MPAGSRATLCIRPEFVRVGGDGPNTVEGRVEALEFVGEVYEADIRVGDERILARIDPDHPVRQGDPVRFSVAPAHCLLVAA